MNGSAPKRATTITVHVPMAFTIRGGRKTIVSEPVNGRRELAYGSREALHSLDELGYVTLRMRTHNALIKALGRAYRWRRMIESGEYASITELAEGEKVNQSYACRLLRLTLLAPAIVDGILDGRYGTSIMLKKLMRPFPSNWNEQIVELRR